MIELLKYYLGLIRCYDSIETLPVWNWDKIRSTDNLSFLIMTNEIKVNREKPNKFIEVILAGKWKRIMSEYIDEFGFSNEFLTMLRLQKQLLILTADYYLTDDRKLITDIELKRKEIELIEKMNDKDKLSDLLSVTISLKQLGYPIDEHRTSVKEFYLICKRIEKENKRHGRPTD